MNVKTEFEIASIIEPYREDIGDMVADACIKAMETAYESTYTFFCRKFEDFDKVGEIKIVPIKEEGQFGQSLDIYYKGKKLTDSETEQYEEQLGQQLSDVLFDTGWEENKSE